MTDIFIHAKSLKISWIRRFINNTVDQDYTSHMFYSFLPHSCTPFPLFMGSVYFSDLARSVVNPFWKEVLLAFSELIVFTIHHIACQPLCNNDMIKVNNKVLYLKSWCNKGVRFVNDILKADGSFLSYYEFQQKFNVQTNFLQYYGLCNAIRSGFDKNTIPKVMEPTCIIPEVLQLILKMKKGCSHIYQTFLNNNIKECKSLTKWKHDFDLEEKKWNFYYVSPFQSTVDINMRWLQFKILNRILYMKDILLKLNIVADNICTFCKNAEETITHIFCTCPYSNGIWSNFELWLSNHNITIKITNENKLF